MTEWGATQPAFAAEPFGNGGKAFGNGAAEVIEGWGAPVNDGGLGGAEGWGNAAPINDDDGPDVPKKQRVRKKDVEQ